MVGTLETQIHALRECLEQRDQEVHMLEGEVEDYRVEIEKNLEGTVEISLLQQSLPQVTNDQDISVETQRPSLEVVLEVC